MLKSLGAAETLSVWSYCSASDSERPSTLLSGTSDSDVRQHFGRAPTNKWAAFIHSAGYYILVYTITKNTSIVTAVSSNGHAETVYARLHVDKFSMLKYFRGQVDPRKYFNTKIYLTIILLHENFLIYGSHTSS